MRYADTSRGRPYSKDPAVARIQDRYLMYYSIPPYRDGRPDDGWAIGIAESDNLEDWRKIGEILPEDDCEKKGLCAPGAVVLDGRLHLFYQTYGNGPRDAICHAVTEDGTTFARNPSNPVFSPAGDWNSGRAIDADVVVHEDRLLLYFATRDPAMKVQMLGLADAPLSSSFGKNDWTQRGDGPVLKPDLPWEQDCIEAPAVCKRGDSLFMFYAGAYNNRPQQIGCAVSADGFAWQRLSDTPLHPNGPPGSWNASESGHPYVFVDNDGQTHLFYQGNNDMGKTWYLSKVGIQWEHNRPVVRPESL